MNLVANQFSPQRPANCLQKTGQVDRVEFMTGGFMVCAARCRVFTASRRFLSGSFLRLQFTFPAVWTIVISGMLLHTDSAAAQTMSVPQMLSQEKLWNQWAAEEKKLVVDGRYEGRTEQTFRLIRLPIPLNAGRRNPLPDKLRINQRMEVSGRLKLADGKLSFEVSRLTIGDTDIDLIRNRAEQTAKESPEALYALADEFRVTADFYEDERLKEEIGQVVLNAWQLQRRQKQRDAESLWNHAESAASRGLPDNLRDEVRFQSLWMQRQPASGSSVDLKTRIEKHCAGWDQPGKSWTPELEKSYQSDAVAAYLKADDVLRREFHRRLYRDVVVSQYRKRLKQDGSNGTEIAKDLRKMVPEDADAARAAEELAVAFRLQRVEGLSHAELTQTAELLAALGRDADVAPMVSKWIAAQETRLTGTGLTGLLRLATEFTFVAEQWKKPEYREKAAELLKQAWAVAEKEDATEAERIAGQLKLLGWERLKGQWMTYSQIELLPADDVQMAMREGRVVKGMTDEQVVATLGQPARVSRIVSARAIRELWIYDAQGSAGVVVQFQRSRGDNGRTARVSEVTRTR